MTKARESTKWNVPEELAHLNPLARRLSESYGMNEIEEFIASLMPKNLAELAEAHADFRTRRLIHVFNRWYESTAIPDLESTGAESFLRLLIVFDLLAKRGVRPFNKFKNPLVWKTERPRKSSSLKPPSQFQYLLPAMRKHGVIGTEQQLVEAGEAIREPERSRLLALRQRAFQDEALRAWLASPPEKRFKREHQLLNSLMLMLDHMG